MRSLPAALLLAVTATACGSPEAQPQEPDPMQATQVAAAPAPAAPADYIGVITSRRTQVISAGFRGRIDKLYIQPGQHVKAGDAIAKLDATELLAKLEGAKASAAAARGSSARRARSPTRRR